MSFMSGLSFVLSALAFVPWLLMGGALGSLLSMVAVLPAVVAIGKGDRKYGWPALGFAAVVTILGVLPFLIQGS